MACVGEKSSDLSADEMVKLIIDKNATKKVIAEVEAGFDVNSMKKVSLTHSRSRLWVLRSAHRVMHVHTTIMPIMTGR